MVNRSKLRLALAAERGVDFKKIQEKRKYKDSIKRQKKVGGSARPEKVAEKAGEGEEEEKEGESEGSTEGSDDERINLDAIDESDTSDSSIDADRYDHDPELQATKRVSNATNGLRIDKVQASYLGERNNGRSGSSGEEELNSDDDEEEVPVSDLEDLSEDDKEDLIAHTRLTINNTVALTSALGRIAIPTDNSTTFASHQSVTSSTETAISIPDVSDDLQRELAFYSQALEAVRIGRTKLRTEGVPFSRPKDYFAEMIKEDAHMEKVKAKLVEEASAKKASAEARKQRDLKKFGKQVQVAKLQERQKEKKQTLEKIKTLKRKRQESGGDNGTNEGDIFDVAVDTEISTTSRSQRSGAGRGAVAGRPLANKRRQKKDDKFGFGGKKRHVKSGDAMSSGDLSGFNVRKMKAAGPPGRGKVSKPQRPGKARRKTMTK